MDHKQRLVTFGYLIIFGLTHFCSCNIHRSLSSGTQIKCRLKLPQLIEEVEDEELGLYDRILDKVFDKVWLYAIPASILVGSTGIFPLLIFNKVNFPSGRKLNEAISPAHLRILLSFSVGGLFGDVFLHLLPEAWMYLDYSNPLAGVQLGMWIISGLLCFLLIEKIFTIHEINEQQKKDKKKDKVVSDQTNKVVTSEKHGMANGVISEKHGMANGIIKNGIIKRKRQASGDETDVIPDNQKIAQNSQKENLDTEKTENLDTEKKIIGYLNLMANCIDNFTHGLAVAGSFIVSVPVGVCTTFAILLHEIPHEIGDFAILLKAGFSQWEAAKGQMITASGALIGCVFGLLADCAGDSTSRVLPFTSGGFIYIACVTVIPELLKEDDLIESIKQVLALFSGIAVMGLASLCQ